MSRRIPAALVIVLFGCRLANADTPAEYKDLEKMVVKALEAYNKDDGKGVFADYFSALRDQDSTVMYNALFKPFKASHGKYKSHEFQAKGSIKEDEIAALVLLAQFEKQKALIYVNFGKEDGKMRIQQIQIQEAK